uniref:HECT domain-containing protein n=1 Tax=Amphimedon queenslandica TaxID=400682 RepID=A0A1X7V4T8_AMPQE
MIAMLEEGISGCDLSNVLLFLNEMSRIPLLGFEKSITILFLKYGNFPTVSTCGIEIRLPTIHDTYEKCKDVMIHAIKGNNGFGGGP